MPRAAQCKEEDSHKTVAGGLDIETETEPYVALLPPENGKSVL